MKRAPLLSHQVPRQRGPVSLRLRDEQAGLSSGGGLRLTYHQALGLSTGAPRAQMGAGNKWERFP